MKWFLVRLPKGGIALNTRTVAVKVRDSLPPQLQHPTLEVIPVFEITSLLHEWSEMLPKMEKNLTLDEISIHRACMQDLVDRLNRVRN